MSRRKLSCRFGKSPDAGSRNAQTSNGTKSGAAVSGLLPASLAQPPLVNRSAVFDTAYTPYGESYDTRGTLTADFTGDLQDLFSGLFDTPNREIAQNSSRWLSPDPAHASWNAYAYSTNPNGQIDPSGLGPRVPCPGACPPQNPWFGPPDPFQYIPLEDWNAGFSNYLNPLLNPLTTSAYYSYSGFPVFTVVGPSPQTSVALIDEDGNVTFSDPLYTIRNSIYFSGAMRWPINGGTLDGVFGRISVFVDREPNPYITVGTDALGIIGDATHHSSLGRYGMLINALNDRSPTNWVLTGSTFIPVVGEGVASVTIVLDVGTPLAQGFVDHVVSPMLDAAPVQNIEDGNGHLIPNPALMDDCQVMGAC